jgi:hypothetical protein
MQMGRTIETKCRGHMRHIGLGHPEKLSVAQHKFGTGHNFGNTSILDVALGYMDHLIQEVIKIGLHHRNFNRAEVSISVSPVTKTTKGYCNKPIWR